MPHDKLTFEDFVRSIKKFEYNTDQYPFVEKLRKIFHGWTGPIENLHCFFEDSDKLQQITIEEDTKTKFHRHYYDSPYYNEFISLYYRFVKEVVLPLFKTEDDRFIVQKDPCFRIHLPNNTALGKRTTMGDPEDKIGIHCDGEYGHPGGEINFMVTFGNQQGTNSCYVESSIGSEEYIPLEMKYGEFMSFYGNKLRHFNKTNNTGDARVSIDFRIIPISKYNDENNTVSLHGKRPFRVGGYYIEISRD